MIALRFVYTNVLMPWIGTSECESEKKRRIIAVWHSVSEHFVAVGVSSSKHYWIDVMASDATPFDTWRFVSIYSKIPLPLPFSFAAHVNIGSLVKEIYVLTLPSCIVLQPNVWVIEKEGKIVFLLWFAQTYVSYCEYATTMANQNRQGSNWREKVDEKKRASARNIRNQTYPGIQVCLCLMYE